MLEGNLIEYPLPDLLASLASQRETGLLEIDLGSTTGHFVFHDGQLVNARVGSIQGLSAVNVMISSVAAPFRFQTQQVSSESFNWDDNDRTILARLIAARTTIHGEISSEKKSEPPVPRPLFSLASTSTEAEGAPSRPLFSLSDVDSQIQPPLKSFTDEVSTESPEQVDKFQAYDLCSPQVVTGNQSLRFIRTHAFATTILITCFAVPAIIGVARAIIKNTRQSTVTRPTSRAESSSQEARGINLNNVSDQPIIINKQVEASGKVEFRARNANVSKQQDMLVPSTSPSSNSSLGDSSSSNSPGTNSPAPRDTTEASKTVSVTVVTRIENGRVVEAYVAKRQPGMETYEATAVRLARQRRYEASKNGTETQSLTITGK